MTLSRKWILQLAATATAIALAACSSAPTVPGPAPSPSAIPEVMGPPSPTETYGPFPGATPSPAPAAAAAPAAVANPDQISLVFGPGLARGFVYVGALKGLAELKVPVRAIYATETGALAAALHFTQPNVNRVDWALLRFTEKNLAKGESGISILKLKSPEHDLEDKLREVFGGRRVEAYAGRLHIFLEDAKSGEVFEARKGELWKVVRAALAGTNGFSPFAVEGRDSRAATHGLAEEIHEARTTEVYPTVVVAAGTPASESLRQEAEGSHSMLIAVPLPGVDDAELKQRNQAIFAGKNAVHEASARILGLVGRASEPERESGP